jgi:hypothetical protein
MAFFEIYSESYAQYPLLVIKGAGAGREVTARGLVRYWKFQSGRKVGQAVPAHFRIVNSTNLLIEI